ncbi:sulfotransferase domain-containing protein [Desulfocicer niacini]
MKNLIFVLGMHRSGTSAMTGVLNQLGCSSGKDEELLSSTQYNELGYFEREDFVECNEAILCENFLGLFPELKTLNYFEDLNTLDGFGWLFGAWVPYIKENLSANIYKKIDKFINNIKLFKQSYGSPITIKDPRLSLTFSIWKKFLKSKAPVIIMIRNPSNVADSLYKRDKIIPNISMDMWLTYTKAAFKNATDCPSKVIDYDDLINNTAETVQSVISFLQTNNVEINFNFNQAKKHIKATLRHEKKMEFNYINHAALDVYSNIKNGDLSIIEKKSWPFRTDKRGWEKALIQPLYVQKEFQKIALIQRTKRLLSHPITGPVIKTVRALKNDTSFGNCEY